MEQQPLAVVAAADADDIVTVVRHAIRDRVPVTAQPIGHGATRALDGTVIIRTGALQDISIDVERQTARVGAGVKWGRLLAAAGEVGLTGLAGSSPDPSVAGFCLGGGMSWFGRKHGIAANSVVAVEAVDPSGERVRVTADSDPELFWALRGCGGEFGIVTALELKLYPAPNLYGGRLLWPIDHAPAALEAFGKLSVHADHDLTLWAHLVRFPPTPDVPEPLRGGAFVSIDLTYLGDASTGAAVADELRTVAEPVQDTMGPMPVANLGDICAEPVDPLPFGEHSALLTGFAVEPLLELAGPGRDAPDIVQLRQLGGALTRPGDPPSAAGVVAEPYLLHLIGIPVSGERAAAIEESFSRAGELFADIDSGRTTLNFLGQRNRLERVFPVDTLARLRELKQSRDPEGVIRGNRPLAIEAADPA